MSGMGRERCRRIRGNGIVGVGILEAKDNVDIAFMIPTRAKTTHVYVYLERVCDAGEA